MNPRYRILNIDGERYILDMGKSFWKILFPFFYWILPNTAYKVNNQEVIDKIRAPEVKQKTAVRDGLFAGIIGVILANLLHPMVSFFDIPSIPLVNAIVVLIVALLILSVFIFINMRSKKNLYRMVKLEHYTTKQLWIRPQSSKNFFYILFFYFFGLGSIILVWGGFIQLANALILFAGMIFMFFLLFLSALTVPVGDTSVKFKGDKKAVG
jgi:uncharacterized membrane protein (TIGR01218 family)